MTFDDVKYTIKNHILNKISNGDLNRLCDIFSISLSDRRKNVTKSLIDSIFLTSDLTLLHNILCMLNSSETDTNSSISTNIQISQHNFIPNFNRLSSPIVYPSLNVSLISKLYTLSNEVINKSPIDIRPELIDGVNAQNIFVANFTKYPQGYFNAPSSAPSFINGRVNLPNCQLPYISKNVIIKPSPFYCCQVILHPTSLLIPKPTPNIIQTNRIMSKMPLNFILSTSVRQLLTTHCYQSNNKRIYKWQILLRFGLYDPEKVFPPNSEDVEYLMEYIPPYLSISVNNTAVPLWEILPSNNINKEGKRHSRPVNISDYIKYNQVDEKGYRQVININWWQTPGLYLYYYVGVFLERKLDVNELLNQFIKKTHTVQRPMSFTLDFIREKFSTNNQLSKIKEDDDDDDLIISSVLPISLQCPVGKSRISCPLRSINCQHLQCFDAHLYLMMNERRSVWKCPVCDGQANLDELFVDDYFQQILKDFESDDDIIDVNVNPDGTYIPVAAKESREGKQHVGNIISNVEATSYPSENINLTSSDNNNTETLPIILLESDGEEKMSAVSRENLNKAAPLKVIEPILVNTPAKQAARPMTIDLTSDSDEDNKTIKFNEAPVILQKTENVQPSFDSHNTQTTQNILQKSHNRVNIPKLLPKINFNIPEKKNFHSPLINDHFSIAHNPYQRNSNGNRLLLPANKHQTIIPNMMWMQNQSYPYIYPKEPIHKYIPQSFVTSQTFSIPASQSTQPSIGNQYKPFDIVHVTNDHIKRKAKYISIGSVNNGGISGQISNICTSQSTSSPNSLQKKNKKIRKELPKSRGYRRSSRIQRQSQKKYNESSDEFDIGESDDSIIFSQTKEKHRNYFNDTETSGSEQSCSKRKRLMCNSSSEEEVVDKPAIIEDVSINLKYPVICVPKLDQGLIKSFFQQKQEDDGKEVFTPNLLSGLSTDSF